MTVPAESPETRKSVLLALGWNIHEINLGVAEYAKQANWILNDIMCHSGQLPSQWTGEGVITLINKEHTHVRADFVEMLRKLKVPVVNLGDYAADFIKARVLPDNIEIGRIAAQHFLSRGFRHFAFCQFGSATVVHERLAGFRELVEARGHLFYHLNFETVPLAERTQENLLPWLAVQLRDLPKPVAVMAQYDAEANDVVRACRLHGIRVPEDVAVVGVDNDPIYSQFGPVRLSSVNSNRQLAGFKAAEILDGLMSGKPQPKLLRIEPDGLEVRASSDFLAAEDVHTAKALRYIFENFRRPITVEDVVAHSGSSRRNLYKLFQRQVGHPIYVELMRQRIEEAKRLLRSTNEKLQYIADESGFIDADRLSKSFKRFCSLSPSEYRVEYQRMSKTEKGGT